MITPNPVRTAVRTSKREQRFQEVFGTTRPACGVCGTTDPTVIVTPRNPLVEEHHVGGRAASDLTVPLCRNHHAGQTERLNVLGVPMAYDGESGWADVLGAVLSGMGALLEVLAAALVELGAWLPRFADALADELTAGPPGAVNDLGSAAGRALVRVPLPTRVGRPIEAR